VVAVHLHTYGSQFQLLTTGLYLHTKFLLTDCRLQITVAVHLTGKFVAGHSKVDVLKMEKKRIRYCLNYSGKKFCPLKIEIQ